MKHPLQSKFAVTIRANFGKWSVVHNINKETAKKPHKPTRNSENKAHKKQKTIAYEAYLWYNVLSYIILFVLQERREN